MLAVLPFTVSVIGVVVVPSFWIICIDKETSAPSISPLSWNFCNWGKPIVTLTASIFELVICLDTGVSLVTTTPTAVSDSCSVIPDIAVWFEVPNLGSNDTFWKLKSSVAGLVPAACWRTCVPLRNTSFNALVLYSVEPCDPVAEGKPDITPSSRN